MNFSPEQFQQRLLAWFDEHGRKSLPWQQDKTPYRVWVSEIMLQQTQVNTVIPYFENFMQRFPDLTSLAHADEDAVLHAWAGLGYYSRARNLHRAAKQVIANFAGNLPTIVADLQTLPGIGQSTAGAIAAIAFGQQATILDGNVKRVLTRIYGITEPATDKSTEKKLWEIASAHTPAKRSADYTQAIMDLGATLCTRSKPACDRCPMSDLCIAKANDLTASIPAKKSTRKIPTRKATFLLLKHENYVLMLKRPPKGIWGGLYSLPELPGTPENELIDTYCRNSLRLTVCRHQALPSFRHTFSHYHLDIHPVVLEVTKTAAKIMDAEDGLWYNLRDPDSVGLPKPVQSILDMLK